jgi:prolyl-tRNA editing enzyme YbaK/EbsC (Cys-tRNA(Pro) deacylase)
MRTKSPIQELVREVDVAYAVVPRRSALSTEEDAPKTLIRAHNYARVLIYFVDGVPIEAVVREAMTVNLDRLLQLAQGHDIRLAQHEELEQLFPDREAGIMPSANTASRPLVFVDVALAAEAELLFDADVLSETIRIRWPDFAATIRPIVGRFAEAQLDRVGGFRLSYRE